jgi:hypothetical protein
MANVSDQERPSIQGAMTAIVTQWVKSAPLRRSQALTDPAEALRALTKPFSPKVLALITDWIQKH